MAIDEKMLGLKLGGNTWCTQEKSV